ncbi:hypothetical protein ACWCPF_23650 [Streptomyces sp. NPDC001858]
MSTSTLPSARGSRLGATALTVLAAAGFTCLAAPSAMAVGEAGDIRIHREQVPPGVSKDDPVACRFYLDAANFADLKAVTYTIKAKPPTNGTATVTGTIDLTQGAGHTDTLGLAEGSYTLSWDLPAADGGVVASTRVKVFRVNCRENGGRGGNQGPNRPITDDGQEAAAPGGPAGGDETPTGQTATGQTATGQTATGQTATGQTATGQTATGQTATGQTAVGENAAGQTAADQSATGQTATGQTATGQGGTTATGQGGTTATGRGGSAQSGTAQGGSAWSGEKGGAPAGGVHAGGGGLADPARAFTPLAGAAAVGLVAVGGVAYFRLTRRRTHGAA